MRYGLGILLVVAVAFAAAAGCGKPATPGDQATAPAAGSSSANAASDRGTTAAAGGNSEGPDAAVYKFLDAVRTGNDQTAESMFTKLAREKIKELDVQVAPRGSDTARFEIGKTELLDGDGARVFCKWTDMDKEGKPRTDDMCWMLRKEPEGWRVAGMAATVFEGEDPLLLDFENPKETLQKLELLKEEIARRATAQGGTSDAQARQPDNPPESIQR